MQIVFVAGFGPIVTDMTAARAFYQSALGIPFEGDDSYLAASHALVGVKHFALWPLAGAAESCFGTTTWPTDVPAPQGWVEFEVDDVAAATAEMQAQGYHMLTPSKTEPWGQTVARLLSPEGLLVGLTYTPALRSPSASE